MRCMRIPLLAFTLLAAVPLLAAQAEFENFLDGGAKKPASAKPRPPGAKVLLAPKAKVWNPVWLPDGRRIACLSDESGEPVWVVDTQDGTKIRFGEDGPKSSLAALPDGRLLYVAGSGSQRLIRLLSTGERRETALCAGWNVSVGSDGKELACDTPRGPIVRALNEAQPLEARLPLPDARTVEDACPRFAGAGAILYAQQGHVYLWDRRSDKPERVAAQNMQDLTFYQWALPSADGRLAALFSTNASALSKPPSTWLLPLTGEARRPREICLGQPVEWIDAHALLVLRAGNVFRVEATAGAKAKLLVEGVAGAALSPDGKRLALLAAIQDTNGDGQVDWRDGTSLLLKEPP